MIPFPPAWDGKEPIADALERNGVLDAIQGALAARDRAVAVLRLLAAGVDYATAISFIESAGLK